MLPGKTYTPEDLLGIVVRRKWALLIPVVLISAGTALATHFLPDKYRSETVILVVPQRVPESYVRSTVTSKIEDRLQSISQQILSRTRLERIIQDFSLYTRERSTAVMEDVVEQMRKDISIEVLKGDAFRVAYIGDSPQTVTKVTERLASLFIEENMRDRELLADGTSQFLEAQVEDARRRLVEQEKRLEVYRKQFSGELPSQADANLQVVQNTQMQIQAVLESINRARDRKVVVERSIADLGLPEVLPPVARDPGGQDAPVLSGSTTAEQLASAEQTLQALLLRLTPQHPDVVRLKRLVADLRQRADAELATPLSAEAALSVTPADLARSNQAKALHEELDALNRQIVNKEAEEKRLREVAASYQTRIEAVPTRESELAELTRDYTTLQQIYTGLLSKNEESKIAANLERRQIGEQFRLLDPARPPEKPFSPNRMRIDLIGAFVGLGISMFLVALLEYRDTSFRTSEDVTTVLSLPVLAQIPMMVNSRERRRRLRWRLALSTAAAALLVGAGGVAWSLGMLDGLLKRL